MPSLFDFRLHTRTARWMYLLLGACLLSACGWHLRGISPMPDFLHTLYLESQAPDAFNQQLDAQLTLNQVRIVPTPDRALTHMLVDNLAINEKTLTVNSSGQISEYELNGTLSVRVLRWHPPSDDAPEPQLHKAYTIDLQARRTFSNNLSNVIGTERARLEQTQSMYRELLQQLMRRLQRLAQYQDDDASTRQQPDS